MSLWVTSKLNINGATSAPQASGGEGAAFLSGDPFVSEYNGQLHVAYGTIAAEVWDVWCAAVPSASSRWNPQRIDSDSNPGNIPVQAGPSIGVYQDQQHFCYIRGEIDTGSGVPEPGTIFDSFYDGSSWIPQPIGSPGALYSNINLLPPVFVYPFLVSIWGFANQQHLTYVDDKTNVVDWFYDGNAWHSQQINNGANTQAPGAYSKPFGCVFTPPTYPYLPPAQASGQQHVTYLASDRSIWDAWFDGVTGHPWTMQKLNLNGRTSGPAAASAPFVWVVPLDVWSPYQQQQHFTYVADDGSIWDAWYNVPSDSWSAQKLNIDAAGAPFHTTNAPPASLNPPSACVAGNYADGEAILEQHVAYCDADGTIWDLWYDGAPQWHSRAVNVVEEAGGPPAVGNVCLFYYAAVDNDGTVYGQLHFAWQAAGGEIWDAWYTLNPIPGQPGGRG